ncbi:MAG: type II toxin-antitoxin system RelE/ParE family toxin [Alphaproteobacteria bacterium]|nr:type II toxin-antitoxin system RelE/ParE family toxin [Alphaproteobacteria bacterium]
MAYSIHWTRRAYSDLDNIYHFYCKLSTKRVATSRLNVLKRDIEQLKSMPNIGQLDEDYCHTPTYRFLVVLNYRVYYFIEDMDVFIAAIWDCRQGGTAFE